jgi:hypothetical protein
MLVKVDKVYSVIHDKLYDFLAYYFGGKMSEFIIEHDGSLKKDLISPQLFFWYKAHKSGKNSYSSKKSLTSPAFPSKYFSAKLDLSSEVKHNYVVITR